MKKLLILLSCIFCFVFPIAIGSGSIQTVVFTPSAADMCGESLQYVTFTAAGILNMENTTLTSVTARLIITGNPGLSFITPQDINMGNINPLSQAPGSLSWTVQCNSPVQGTYTAYINYSSANGYKATSAGEATSIITVHDSQPFLGNITLVEGNSTSQGQQEARVINDNMPTIKVITTRNSLCKGSLGHDEAYQVWISTFSACKKTIIILFQAL